MRDRELGRKPSETIGRLAKYFLYIGLSKRETEKRIGEFMLECDPGIVLLEWEDVIARSIRNAKKYPLLVLDSIPITKPEMEKIDALAGRQLRRLAFVLLCIAKYRCASTGERNMWVNSPDNEIMKMANVNTSISRQCMLFAKLRELGMIRFSRRVDNTSVEVLFAEDGETVLSVKDFRNLGYQYLMFHGEDYFVCSECGITERGNSSPNGGRKKKYCKACAVKIHTKQTVDSVMRERKKPQSA